MFPSPYRRQSLGAAFAALAAATSFGQLGSGDESDPGALSIAALSLDELMAVEVTTPGKVPEAIRDTPASVYLVDRKDIETYGYATLTEVLNNVPGFYNIDNYVGASANFGIRGFWNGRSQNGSVAILVNGIPQARMENWATPFESLNLPVEAIDRIEVSRGPNSVIYGDGASFGAINIITNDSYAKNQVTTAYGSLGEQRVSARWSQLAQDGYFTANAGYHESDGVDYQLAELMSPAKLALIPFYGESDPEADLEGKMQQSGKYLGLSGGWKWLTADYTFDEGMTEFFSGVPAIADGNRRLARTSRFSVGADAPLTDQLDWSTRVTYTDFQHEIDYDALYEDILAINTRSYQGWEIESLLAYDPSERMRLLGGVNWQRMSNNLEYTHIPDFGAIGEAVVVDRRDTQSIFGQLTFDLTDALRLVGGYRLEQLKEYDRRGYYDYPNDLEQRFGGIEGGTTNGMPRASLIYQISKSQALKFMAGDAVKFPAVEGTIFEPERTRTFEINYNYSSAAQLWSVSFFRNSLSDVLIEELVFLSNGLVDVDPRRGGAIRTNGVEAVVKMDFGDHIRAELGATWQDSENRSHPDGILSYSPQLVAHAKLAYRRDDFTAAAIARFVDDMHSFYNTDPDLRPDRGTEGFFGDASPERAVVDLNVRWDNLWEGVFVSTQVTNLFDTEIRYPNNPGNGVLLDRGTLGPGRGIRAEIGLKF